MADAAGNRGGWLSPSMGPLIGLRVSVSRNPWRIGPAWAVLAGVLASGAEILGGMPLLRLVGAIVLADSAWGAVWAVMATGSGELGAPSSWNLPYAQIASPMVRATERLRRLASGIGCHNLLVSVALAGGVAALLGRWAFLLTGLALIVALGAQASAERGYHPSLAYAILTTGLPWALGLSLSGRSGRDLFGAVLLGSTFVLLVWGTERIVSVEGAGMWGAWLGQGAVLAILAGLRLPWAVSLTAALFLPPSWWLLRANAKCPTQETMKSPQTAKSLSVAVDRSTIWWWMVFLLAAVALRQLVTL